MDQKWPEVQMVRSPKARSPKTRSLKVSSPKARSQATPVGSQRGLPFGPEPKGPEEMAKSVDEGR